MLLRKKLNKSIVFRLSLWYNFFIAILIFMMLIFSFILSERFIDLNIKNEMSEQSIKFSRELEEFESFDDGIYYAIYDKEGKLIYGEVPFGFDENLGFNKSTLKRYTNLGTRFLYYDVEIPRGNLGFIRATTLDYKDRREFNLFFSIMSIISPLILVITVFGGYKILKKAFVPVDEISKIALEIRESKDFSKRINIKESDDELSRLSKTVNLMLETVEDSFEREKQFNNDVSHELRTPLSVILYESEYGIKYIDDLEESKESYKTINKQALRIKAMIEQIMELVKVEKYTGNLKELDLVELVRDRIEDYEILSRGSDKKFNCKVEGEKYYINGDNLLLNRLLDNLISNAIKFSKTEVKISLYEKEDSIYLEVEDDGIGIKKEDLDKIWNRFYQVDRARNKNENLGIGLGLALVKNIADIHNAKLEIESSYGSGSRFIFTAKKLE